ncbi:hypothetical protein DRJ25_03860 [Candidatus Woesearchaeota archaeon]|nr:MAG: hypothetical protein DRJ25_03860 [Candidatus Woesearchaeota archaeon]
MAMTKAQLRVLRLFHAVLVKEGIELEVVRDDHVQEGANLELVMQGERINLDEGCYHTINAGTVLRLIEDSKIAILKAELKTSRTENTRLTKRLKELEKQLKGEAE